MVAKIGIVDAHPVFRLGILHALAEFSDLTPVAEAGTLSEGLALLDVEEINVILLGTNLPRHESITLARIIHEKKINTRTIVLTAYEEDQILFFEMLSWRVAGYLAKTEPPANIIDTIQKCIQGNMGYISRKFERTFLKKRITDIIAQKLTTQENKILSLLARGLSNHQIASTLFISEKTVKNHITNIFKKLSVKKRSEAIAWAWHHGVLLEDSE